MRKLEGLKPERVFYYFEEICKIPHGSGNTEAISKYLQDFAAEHKLECKSDEIGNVIIYKPGSAGHEQAAPVIIQGHMDMVAEKTPGSAHDFTKDGLDLGVDGDMIFAKDTTLGGDDGIAVAYCLAVLEASDMVHPPLEVVITTDEEVGMLGAAVLDYSALKGRRLINIDSEEEGVFCVGCAGGLSGICSIPVQYMEASGMKYTLTITGLKGGHSGICIANGLVNANCMMGRILHSLSGRTEFFISELEGGLKDNASPRESRAVLLMDESQEAAVREWLDKTQADLRHEYLGTDEGITLTLVKEGAATEPVLHPVSMEKVLFFLVQMPDGITKRSGSIPGLVETSMNLGILRLTPDALEASGSLRSAVESGKDALAERLEYLTEFLGGSFKREGMYPAWEYKADSPLRDLMVETYTELFGKEPVVEMIHAGLECGLFYERIPGIDCISFGPQMHNVHTVSERLSVSSAERMWNFLTEVLKKLA